MYALAKGHENMYIRALETWQGPYNTQLNWFLKKDEPKAEYTPQKSSHSSRRRSHDGLDEEEPGDSLPKKFTYAVSTQGRLT